MRRDGGAGGDSNSTDAMIRPKPHLLLSEVTLQPALGEFIEIVNPTASAVSLADYSLADSGDYWRLPAGAPTINVSDFIVEFPMTAMIPAGGAITVTTGTAVAFMATYGVSPTYSI